MKSRTRSRKPASIGSNHSSRRPTAISASEPRTGNFVLLLVMAWSPPAHNAGIVWVSAPGDYATFNSNHTPDGTSVVAHFQEMHRPQLSMHFHCAPALNLRITREQKPPAPPLHREDNTGVVRSTIDRQHIVAQPRFRKLQ